MKNLSIDSSDQEILDALYDWLDLLISERYRDAYEYTYQPDGHFWTPELLQERIEFMASQYDSIFCIPENHDDSQDFEKDIHHIARPDLDALPPKVIGDCRLIGSYKSLLAEDNRQDPNILGEAFFQMPFGNEWSDFWTTFIMYKHNKTMVLILGDFHT